MMKQKSIFYIITSILLWSSFQMGAQKKELPKHEKEAIQFVFEGNQQLAEKKNFIEGEKSYRKAIAKDPNNSTAKYNLGVSYHATKNFQEAALRSEQAAKLAKTKAEKHFAYHNLGNSYMGMQDAEKAVEAYKNALRNNPTDEETRYNLALAKKAKEEQDKQNKDNKDNKDENKENKEGKDKKDSDKDKDGDKKDDKKEGKDKEDKDKDKKDGEDKKDEDKSDEEKKKEDPKDGEGDKEEDKKPPKPVPGKLSPEQVKSLLEAMNEQEKNVQDKINAEKVKGSKVNTEKDW